MPRVSLQITQPAHPKQILEGPSSVFSEGARQLRIGRRERARPPGNANLGSAEGKRVGTRGSGGERQTPPSKKKKQVRGMGRGACRVLKQERAGREVSVRGRRSPPLRPESLEHTQRDSAQCPLAGPHRQRFSPGSPKFDTQGVDTTLTSFAFHQPLSLLFAPPIG